ncbi:hypothetical protein MP228_011798 [Amoeboaphelidium protococcarum]|nr:hypothetical protein MP228_011798 [Amoeboaphelidium protococcarum]
MIFNLPLQFPATLPEQLHPSDNWVTWEQDDADIGAFDPAVHLNVSTPEYLVDLAFQQHTSDRKQSTGLDSINDIKGINEWPGLAYTAPFRLLSDKGVKALRKIIDRQAAENLLIKQSDARTPLCLRGLGYSSPFIRDFCRSVAIDNLLSTFASGYNYDGNIDKVAAHTMPMNYAQVNVGAIGGDKPVDKWHVDSVDYVMVVMLSNVSEMVGGEFELIPTDAKLAFEQLSSDAKDLQTVKVKYPSAGYAMFMQGSKLVHHVTKVLSANEPRMTLVNSYISMQVDRLADSTKYATFAEGDPKHVTPLEYARHKCWRVQGFLKQITDGVAFPSAREMAEEQSRINWLQSQIFSKIDQSIADLQLLKNVLAGTQQDSVGYYDEESKTVKYDFKQN